MADHPIIFSAPMIHALLDGRKTMTRRLAWRDTGIFDHKGAVQGRSPWQKVQPGDRLWVREAWAGYLEKVKIPGQRQPAECPIVAYRATDENDYLPGMKWKPSIHMPRWASRLTLIVTATKIERLQEISEADAKAEGVKPAIAGQSGSGPVRTFRTGFVRLWGELHGTESWLSDPEVVALTFRVISANIDSGEALAA